MKTRTLLSHIFLVISLISGCSSESQPAEPKAKILADGAEHVIIGGEPIWPADAVYFEIEQVFGTDEDQPESMLAKPEDIRVDNQGNVIIMDWKDGKLISFGPDGSLNWKAGSNGEGPGEFQYMLDMMVGPDGKAYLMNQNNTRLDIWSADGEFIESYPIDRETLGYATRFISITEEGEYIVVNSPSKTIDISVKTAKVIDDKLVYIEEFLIAGLDTIPSALIVPVDVAYRNGNITAAVFRDSLVSETYTMSGERVRRVQYGNETIAPVGLGLLMGQMAVSIPYGYKGTPKQIGTDLYLWQYFTSDNVSNVTEADESVAKIDPMELPEINNHYVMIIFNSAGKLLWKLTSDNENSLANANIKVVNENGDIYVRTDDPYPQIQRGRLIMPESNN